MIKYRPERYPISLSIKDEQTFDNIDQMKLFILNWMGRVALYIGKMPYLPDDITISEPTGSDPFVGWKNVRAVILDHHCIGYCGE